jgi:hypothetical protein
MAPPPDWNLLPAGEAAAWAAAWLARRPLQRSLAWVARQFDTLQALLDLTPPPDTHWESGPPGFILRLAGDLRQMRADLSADYGRLSIPVPAGAEHANTFPLPPASGHDTFRLRHPGSERAALATLEGLGFSKSQSGSSFQLNGENAILTFYASIGARVPEGWRIEWAAGLRRILDQIEVARFRWQDGGGGAGGWLSGELTCATDSGFHVDRVEIERVLRGGGSRDLRGARGKRVVIDLGVAAELQEVWRDIAPRQDAPDHFRFRPEQKAYLLSTLGESHIRDNFPPITEESAGAAAGLLRPYQRDGVAWLAGQCQAGLGALLADDMGLGKTLQTLVMLEWRRRGGATGPALVVCPTSLLTTWRDEAGRFYPDWRVLIAHGAERADRWAEADTCQMVLTSYALIDRDLARLRQRRFHTIVLDEASLVRNPDTKAARALRHLQGEARVALTGTPVENGIRDLWSVFEFLQPGYLGPRDDFRLRYENPLAGPQSDPRLLQRLQRRISPFFLRRLKSTVAKDLPERLECTEWCEMDARRQGCTTKYYANPVKSWPLPRRARMRRRGWGCSPRCCACVRFVVIRLCSGWRQPGPTRRPAPSGNDSGNCCAKPPRAGTRFWFSASSPACSNCCARMRGPWNWSPRG